MTIEEEYTQLQSTVDKAKALGILNNIHKLTPPTTEKEDIAGQVAIIEALRVTPRLQKIFLECQGLMFDELQGKIIQIGHPKMNLLGACCFVDVLRHISEESEFSNYKEEEINPRIFEHYRTNLSFFIYNSDIYEIASHNFNYISSTLMSFIDSSFHKSKNAKLLNLPARVYSEDFLSKALENNQSKNARGGILTSIANLNPFGRKK